MENDPVSEANREMSLKISFEPVVKQCYAMTAWFVLWKPRYFSDHSKINVSYNVASQLHLDVVHHILYSQANLNDSHNQMVVHWAGEKSNVIVALARDSVGATDPKSSSVSIIFYFFPRSFHNFDFQHCIWVYIYQTIHCKIYLDRLALLFSALWVIQMKGPLLLPDPTICTTCKDSLAPLNVTFPSAWQ